MCGPAHNVGVQVASFFLLCHIVSYFPQEFVMVRFYFWRTLGYSVHKIRPQIYTVSSFLLFGVPAIAVALIPYRSSNEVLVYICDTVGTLPAIRFSFFVVI